MIVVRVEGGIWRNPGFESRRDCILDGADPPIHKVEAHENNLKAAEFIAMMSDIHDVFVLTAPSITGYKHS